MNQKDKENAPKKTNMLAWVRDHAGLSVGMVGVALAAFIISDAINNNTKIFGGRDNIVGKVDGVELTIEDFELRTQMNEQKAMNAQGVTELDQATKERLREATWQQFVQAQTFEKEYAKLGIDKISVDELDDMVTGKDPDPAIIQSFSQGGTFDRAALLNFLKVQIKQDPKSNNQWLAFEEQLEKQRIENKYSGMIKAGMNATSLEAQDQFITQSKSVNFKYVSLEYSSVQDSSVKLTDEDYQKYYNENSYKFKPENSRDIKYAVFDITPSGADTAATLAEVNKINTDFRTLNDSALIAQYLLSGIDTTYHIKGTLDPSIEDSIFFAPVGKVLGPTLIGNTFKISKLVSVKEDTAYTMRASHILIKPKGNTMQDTINAMMEAEKILAEIKGGKKFEDAVLKSEDPGSAAQGGDVKWFRDGAMVKEFNDGVKEHNKGDMFVVKTSFGAHLIKVTENKMKRMVRVATLEKKIEASEASEKAVRDQADNFRKKVTNEESFSTVASASNINLRVASNLKTTDKNTAGLTNNKELVKWMFENKKGSISEIIESDNKLVITLITASRSKNNMNWQDIKDQLKDGALKMKKAEVLKDRFVKAMEGNKNEIVTLAIKLGKVAREVPNQTFQNSNVSFAGVENKLVGTVFGLPVGKFSPVIEGESGVFVAMVDQINEPQNKPTEFKTMQADMTNGLRQQGPEYAARGAIQQKADIEDNRYKW
jgi:peptidyl-prolyl cis-trans isomerase D